MNHIREGLAILAERGWTQGTEEDGDGRVCMMDAVALSKFGQARVSVVSDVQAEFDVLRKVIDEQFPGIGVGVRGFNDLPGTTLSDVITIMDKGAVMWDECV